MNVDSIAKKSLTIIKLRFGIPKSGFICGGSLANIMWEIVSGNKAVINDIDIFHYSDVDKNDKNSIIKFAKVETSYFEGYNQITSASETVDSFLIKESTNDGIFNNVRYQSKNSSPQLVIDSFDINCTQVGYSIEEDKFYYTKEFIQFLKTGDLKITNLTTPAHTALRLCKKKLDLNANLNDFEIYLTQYANQYKSDFDDIRRVRFLKRYADMYIQNIAYLHQFFYIRTEIINLDDKPVSIFFLEKNEININPIKKEDLMDITLSSSEFLFYIRNIYKNPSLEKIWKDLHYAYGTTDYIDKEIDSSEIEFLGKLIKSYPRITKNIRGLKFSEQITIIKTVISNISEQYDYETAIAVLENIKMTPNKSFDYDECLLLGLSVRSKVIYKLNTEEALQLNF